MSGCRSILWLRDELLTAVGGSNQKQGGSVEETQAVRRRMATVTPIGAIGALYMATGRRAAGPVCVQNPVSWLMKRTASLWNPRPVGGDFTLRRSWPDVSWRPQTHHVNRTTIKSKKWIRSSETWTRWPNSIGWFIRNISRSQNVLSIVPYLR